MTNHPDRHQEAAKRLCSQRKRLGLSQTDLAALAGTSKQQIYKLENGITRLGVEWAERLAPHLRVSPEYLLGFESVEDNFIEVNCIEKKDKNTSPIAFINTFAGMGGGGLIDDEYYGESIYLDTKFVEEKLKARPCDLRAIYVVGQSMEPILLNGDLVFVDVRKKDYSEPGIFVLFDGAGVVCKWAERVHESDIPKVRIKSENQRFSSYEALAEEVQIIGRVVWFSRSI